MPCGCGQAQCNVGGAQWPRVRELLVELEATLGPPTELQPYMAAMQCAVAAGELSEGLALLRRLHAVPDLISKGLQIRSDQMVSRSDLISKGLDGMRQMLLTACGRAGRVELAETRQSPRCKTSS